MFNDILEIAMTVVAATGLGLFFYFYYTNEVVKMWANRIFKLVPIGTLLKLLSSRVEDKKGIFDAHDILVVMARLSDNIKSIIVDPSNTNFEDVEEEVFSFLNTELSRYREAGVKGVPDISDDVLRTNVRVVFEQIKRALSEDSAGNNR